uniref:Flotillin-like n=1 Tax=Aegilops tauschii subsp. strangulata TaxID=200361 RepID=A0A452YGF1_AEGTS
SEMATFRVADASEYLAITGWGIDDVKLAKKAWVFVGQQCKKFSISPVNYEFEVHAMSAEKLPFILPAVFTIGPKITATGAEASDKRDLEAQLLLYAKLIAPLHRSRSHVHELVKGIIEGETRVLAADLTMEEIFKGTKTFKEKVFNRVQLELNQFGLVIYNANVKQLVDVPGHEYFSYLGQKTQQDAANQAKVDVAEARMKGEVGAKEREGLTRQNAAKVDAETKVLSVRQQGQGLKEEAKVKAEVQVFENAREADIAAAKAELAMKKAGFDKQAKVAEVEAAKAVAIREAELQMEVERKNAMRQTEKLKAEQLSKATVQYETQGSRIKRAVLQQAEGGGGGAVRADEDGGGAQGAGRRAVLRAEDGRGRQAVRQTEGGGVPGPAGQGQDGVRGVHAPGAGRQLLRPQGLPHDRRRHVHGDGEHQRRRSQRHAAQDQHLEQRRRRGRRRRECRQRGRWRQRPAAGGRGVQDAAAASVNGARADWDAAAGVDGRAAQGRRRQLTVVECAFLV